MALQMKTGSFGFLKAVGVSEQLLFALKSAGAKFSLGSDSCQFVKGDKTVNVTFPDGLSASDLVKGKGTSFQKNSAVHLLEEAIKSLAAVSSMPVAKPQSELASPIAQQAATNAAGLSNGLILLRDATALYQRVKGSGKDSVYVVAALTNDVKLAAKIKGSSLSIRVETKNGTIPSLLAESLSAAAIQSKGSYASGHFECANVSPERVLGAVLMDCGVNFSTPIPDANKIRKLSA